MGNKAGGSESRRSTWASTLSSESQVQVGFACKGKTYKVIDHHHNLTMVVPQVLSINESTILRRRSFSGPLSLNVCQIKQKGVKRTCLT